MQFLIDKHSPTVCGTAILRNTFAVAIRNNMYYNIFSTPF